MKPIYLDYNATTPVDPEVAEAMRPYLHERFGNPSSGHFYGLEARSGVEKARRQVAELLDCDPEEVVFTSGGTEANNYAIKGTALINRSRGNHLIASAIEHPSVTEVCNYLAASGFRVTYLPVDEFAMVDPAELERAITPETILITIMHANNEVGTIQPLAAIAQIARRHGVLLHTDAAQSVGKIPTPVDELGVDLLSLAGHKLYAPKGVGALYVRRGIRLEKLIHGAGQELGRRGGTENVPEIVGLGRASEVAGKALEQNREHLQSMRDLLYDGLRRHLEDLKLNGHPQKRLPNTLSLSFRGIEARSLLAAMPEIAASAGAACHSGSLEASSVLRAMRLPPDYAAGTVRFSTGKMTTREEVQAAVEIILRAVQRLKSQKKDSAA